MVVVTLLSAVLVILVSVGSAGFQGLKSDISNLKSDMVASETRQREDMKDLRADFKEYLGEIRADNADIKADVAVLKTDNADIKTDVVSLKGDVAVLKADVVSLKGDVADIKTDVAVLKADNADIKGEIRALNGKMDRLLEGFLAARS